jgi:VWFA-related protein
VKRPPPKQPGAVTPEGLIRLDVVVTDEAGKVVTGLSPWDFKVLDKDQPRKILSFQSFNGVTVKPDPPAQVILLIDLVNPAFQQSARIRQEVADFLNQNDGHLKHPVSIMLLTEAGLRIQPRPSLDGHALRSILDEIKPNIRVYSSAMGEYGAVERMQVSMRALSLIASNEAQRPGRKILVWVGTGWPVLAQEDTVLTPAEERNRRRNFDGLVAISTWLREAQMTVYSLGGGSEFFYKNYLKGVTGPAMTRTSNLALQVFAVQTGGETIDVGNGSNISDQILRCIDDADAYYRISFDPPPAAHADEYHELRLVLDRPGLVAHTISGYYDQPPEHPGTGN